MTKIYLKKKKKPAKKDWAIFTGIEVREIIYKATEKIHSAYVGYYEMPMDGDATAGLAKLFLKSLDRLSGNK